MVSRRAKARDCSSGILFRNKKGNSRRSSGKSLKRAVPGRAGVVVRRVGTECVWYYKPFGILIFSICIYFIPTVFQANKKTNVKKQPCICQSLMTVWSDLLRSLNCRHPGEKA